MNPITPAELAAYFDHTQLRAYAQHKDFEKLCAEAREYGFAMVAINPAPVSLCKDLLAGTSVHVGAAIGFPLGQSTPQVKKYEAADAIANDADEIDYVINITQLKEKNYDFIEHEMAGIVEECRSAGAISKVIFENCYLTEEEKRALCSIAREVRPDFIKTSTGFGTGGATFEDVALMKKCVGDDDSIQTDFYIPLDVAKSIAGAGAGYQSITVVADGTAVNVTSFVDTVGDFFASYYTRNDSWTVSASSLASLLDSMSSMLGTVSLGISAIAALSLLVGGIGVMNIMMVSVTERTREIGTRKALGAPAAAIRMQFITESVILCLIGGIAGILLGLALGAGLSKAVGYAARPSLTAIVVAVGFSMAIGVFFGYYPANKAAKLDPIEALRYE